MNLAPQLFLSPHGCDACDVLHALHTRAAGVPSPTPGWSSAWRTVALSPAGPPPAEVQAVHLTTVEEPTSTMQQIQAAASFAHVIDFDQLESGLAALPASHPWSMHAEQLAEASALMLAYNPSEPNSYDQILAIHGSLRTFYSRIGLLFPPACLIAVGVGGELSRVSASRACAFAGSVSGLDFHELVLCASLKASLPSGEVTWWQWLCGIDAEMAATTAAQVARLQQQTPPGSPRAIRRLSNASSPISSSPAPSMVESFETSPPLRSLTPTSSEVMYLASISLDAAADDELDRDAPPHAISSQLDMVSDCPSAIISPAASKPASPCDILRVPGSPAVSGQPSPARSRTHSNATEAPVHLRLPSMAVPFTTPADLPVPAAPVTVMTRVKTLRRVYSDDALTLDHFRARTTVSEPDQSLDLSKLVISVSPTEPVVCAPVPIGRFEHASTSPFQSFSAATAASRSRAASPPTTTATPNTSARASVETVQEKKEASPSWRIDMSERASPPTLQLATHPVEYCTCAHTVVGIVDALVARSALTSVKVVPCFCETPLVACGLLESSKRGSFTFGPTAILLALLLLILTSVYLLMPALFALQMDDIDADYTSPESTMSISARLWTQAAHLRHAWAAVVADA